MRALPLLASLAAAVALLSLPLATRSAAREETGAGTNAGTGCRGLSPAQADRARSARLDEAVGELARRASGRAPAEQVEALGALVSNMPCMDLENRANVSAAFLVDHVQDALEARRAARARGWNVPWSVFLDAAVPYAALSEPRDGFNARRALRPFMSALVRPNATLEEAVVALNLRAWSFTAPPITFQASSPNKVNAYSPREVIAAKHASCTGESVFLVAALRSVGVPARVAGVPHWLKGPDVCPQGDASPPCGNHNWVGTLLVLVGGEPRPRTDLDRSRRGSASTGPSWTRTAASPA